MSLTQNTDIFSLIILVYTTIILIRTFKIHHVGRSLNSDEIKTRVYAKLSIYDEVNGDVRLAIDRYYALIDKVNYDLSKAETFIALGLFCIFCQNIILWVILALLSMYGDAISTPNKLFIVTFDKLVKNILMENKYTN